MLDHRVGRRTARGGHPVPATLPAAAAVAADGNDQATTLRRLFARPAVRLLPVLAPELHCTVRASWVAKLAQGFARQGERTLVVDAARAQIAAVLGLRARFDLAHAQRGECSVDATVLDAGPGLAIVPAARALQAAKEGGASLLPLLASVGSTSAVRGGCDLILLLLPAAAAAAHVPAGDVLVPLLPTAPELAASLRDIERLRSRMATAARSQSESGPPGRTTTPVFRLLFLGMDAGPAATLAQRLSIGLRPLRRPPTVQFAGAVQVARDLGPVVRAAGGWSLATMELTQ